MTNNFWLGANELCIVPRNGTFGVVEKYEGWYEDRIAEEEAMCEKLKAVGHEIYMQIKEAKEKGEK